MAKKSVLSEAADAVKSVAGAALGAAAAAATTVVVTRVAGALAQGGNRLGQAAPALEQGAAQAVRRRSCRSRRSARPRNGRPPRRRRR